MNAKKGPSPGLGPFLYSGTQLSALKIIKFADGI